MYKDTEEEKTVTKKLYKLKQTLSAIIYIVTDKLLDKVSRLLVLVGLAAQQIGDIVTG